MKEESGLIYVHLCPSSQLSHQKVEIIDKDGSKYFLDLDGFPFVLQEKVELASVRFQRFLESHDIEGLKNGLNQLSELFQTRSEKGITDRIQTLHNNYGFVGNKSVQIDFGRIYYDKKISQDPNPEVKRIMTKIRNRYPLFPDPLNFSETVLSSKEEAF